MTILAYLKSFQRNLVYLAVTAVVVIVMFLTDPRQVLQPHGIFLPASNHIYPEQPADFVALYDHNVPGAKTIGMIRVERHFNQANKDTELEILRYARSLAATAGADGLVVDTFFGTPQPGLERRYILLGKAIIK